MNKFIQGISKEDRNHDGINKTENNGVIPYIFIGQLTRKVTVLERQDSVGRRSS